MWWLPALRQRLAAEKAKQAKQEESRIEELTEEEAAQAKAQAAGATPAPAPAQSDAKEGDGEEGEGKGAVPINNGGICDKYRWSQTLQDLQARLLSSPAARDNLHAAALPPRVIVPVPKGTKAKFIDVQILKKKFKVGVKGADALIDGELYQSIKIEDSTCEIPAVDAKRLNIF